MSSYAALDELTAVQMQRSVAAKKKDPTTKNTKKKATTKKATRNI